MNDLYHAAVSEDAELSRIAAALLAGRESVTICAAMSPQLPNFVVAALLREARARETAVRLLVADVEGSFDFLDDAGRKDLESGRLTIVTMAGSAPGSISHLVDSLALSLWEVDRLLASGELSCDIYAARVRPAVNHHGFDLGNMVGFTPTLLNQEGIQLVLEVSHSGEYTSGFSELDDRAIVYAHVWHDTFSPAFVAPVARVTSNETRDRIAESVALIVPRGATIQVGVGALADAIVDAIAPKPGLSVHTGMLPPSLRTHIDEGRFGGPHAGVSRALTIGTGLSTNAGNAPWAASVRLRPISETHSPATLNAIAGLWALNSAFDVDLSGQVNAEWANGRKRASGGGQVDFMKAAHGSERGAAVIALPSRSRTGQSRIVAALESPSFVTTAACDLDYVVTEYGTAHLTGKTRFERAELLMQIAHPDDRASLGG